MTAPNHALTGALIGLAIGNPVIALPLAFASHFVLDVIPHYDRPQKGVVSRLKSRRFIIDMLVVGAFGCLLIVVALALTRPQHWLLAAICAFVAASPDLFWIPRFVHVLRTGKDIPLNRFLQFHENIQHKAAPRFWWVEALWMLVFGAALIDRL